MSELFESIKSSGKPYVIAEIGVNFFDIARERGLKPLDAAKMMITEAAAAGADAAKFQSYKAEGIAVKDSPSYWDRREEPSRSQFELFSRYDSFGPEEYGELARHCGSSDITFLSTPFDFEAVDYLDQMCPAFKVSSSDITNWPFLRYIAQKSKPVLLSTGASDADEIKDAVSVLENHGTGEISVLHCILSYPTAYEDANLRMIEHLGRLFPDHLLGYSDHTRPDRAMTCLREACRYGARVIEKHFTLDKSLAGNDHYHAMDPDDLRLFVSSAGKVNPPLDESIAAAVGGAYEKRCVPSERAARLNARRSIVARRDIDAGEVIGLEMLTYKRPGTGISPKDIDTVVGTTAKVRIPEDTILSRDVLE